MKSLQAKLTAAMLTLLFGSLIVLSGLNYWKASSLLVGESKDKLFVQVKGSADGVGEWIAGRQTEVVVLATADVVKSGNKREIQKYLANIHTANPMYDDLIFADVNGDFISDEGKTGNVKEREHFKNAMQGKTYISDPFVSKTTGEGIVAFAVPVLSNGKIVGEMVGGVKLSSLSEKVLAQKSGKKGFTFLSQKDGLIIIHPNQEYAMKYNALKDDKADPGHKAITKQMVSGDTGVVLLNVRGKDQYYAFAPVKGTSWALSQFIYKDEVDEPINELTTMLSIIIVVVMIASGLAAAWYARRLTAPLSELREAANRIAGGDISVLKLKHDSDDEIGQLGRAFEIMIVKLRELVEKITDAAAHVAAASEQLTASAEQSALAANNVNNIINDVSSGAERQLKMIDNTVDVAERMSDGAHHMATNANVVSEASGQSAQSAQAGSRTVEKAMTQMTKIEETVRHSADVVTKLGERSNEIGQIVATIVGIAGQTNLLALNAAIEAARAGEQGRGFAVVAEEVRKLAEESQIAAKQIAALINEIREDTDTAVTAMKAGTNEVQLGTAVVNEAGHTFNEIFGMISNLSTQVREITVDIQQTAGGTEQIVGAVREIDGISRTTAEQARAVSGATNEQAAMMREIVESSQALAKMAEELAYTVGEFKV